MKSLDKIRQAISRKPSSGKYLPVVDGLRFAAIFLVVMQHLSERLIKYGSEAIQQSAEQSSVAYLLSRGTIGVFLFFVISGFILGLPFVKLYQKNNNASPNLKKYYWRRLIRIEPPYIIWMSFFAIVLLLMNNLEQAILWPHLLASLTYTHGVIYRQYSIINPVAWSLEVEVQFYLLAPFLASLFFRISSERRRRGVLLAAILIWSIAQYCFGWHYLPFKLTLLGHLQYFLLGLLLADLYAHGKLSQEKKIPLLWDMLGLIGLGLMPFLWSADFFKMLAFCLTLALFFIAALKGKLINQVLRKAWIAGIGGICYTIYLIHLPLLELLTKTFGGFNSEEHFNLYFFKMGLILLPIVLLVSIPAFLILEKPFMQFKVGRKKSLKYIFSIPKTSRL